MTSIEFFIELLSFIGECVDGLLEVLYSFAPVYIVLSVLIGVIVLSIAFGIIRGRKM